MRFILRPILSEIKEFYQNPISKDRFKEYLSKLQGDTKGDMVLPISGFNPMAKDHLLLKIEELEHLHTEDIMEETIEDCNKVLAESIDISEDEIVVVLNIADDLKGSWTNYYTTDFDSKFKLNAFVNRNFCVPYFWTSEGYTQETIRKRTKEYLYRTLYRLNNANPVSLEEHFDQEVFVAAKSMTTIGDIDKSSLEAIEKFYLEHKDSEEYNLIFGFFYGDQGSESLNYMTFGINGITGYDYAKYKSVV